MLAQWLFRSLVVAVFIFLVWGGDTALKAKHWLLSQKSDAELARIKGENMTLRAKLEELSGIADRLPTFNASYRMAIVYSTYPFNIKHSLSINAGENSGINEGMVVVSSDGIFLGQVAKVFKDTSLVQTIFDQNLEMPVRIGKSAKDGVLNGGSVPTVGLIAKDAPIQIGESIYTSGISLPIGIPVGRISAIESEGYESFKKAEVDLPYSLNDLREVLIITNYVLDR